MKMKSCLRNLVDRGILSLDNFAFNSEEKHFPKHSRETLDHVIYFFRVHLVGNEFGNSLRGPESPNFDALVDRNSNSNSNSTEHEIRGFAGNGQSSGGIDSSSGLNIWGIEP